MTSEIPELRKYVACMSQIKRRLNTINSIVNGSLSLGNAEYDDELLSIQIRKTLELVAFSSMVANKEQYSRAYRNFAQHWNAKDMLTSLERINSDFYPAPIYIKEKSKDGVLHIDFIKHGYLTKDQFVSLYNMCGGVLHSKNPYASRRTATLKKSDANKWLIRIVKLLAFHRARFVQGEAGWLVVLEHESDGNVQAFAFEASK